MIRRAIVLLAVCTLVACAKEEPAPPLTEPTQQEVAAALPPPVDVDSDNLLNLAYGASVVSRTGELNLESSAAHAIDGLTSSFWLSPTGTVEKTIVYSFLSPVRIHTIGVTSPSADETPKRVRFDGSMDAKTWRELGTVAVKNQPGRQLMQIAPTVARYVRVHVVEPENVPSRAHAFHVLGDETEPPQTPPFGGCWTINGLPAQIEQDGARITGVFESTPPTYLDGGTDNRVAYVMWTQGPMWGYAALTRTPDGAHLTGLKFYELFDARNLGDALFGVRCDANTPHPPFGHLLPASGEKGESSDGPSPRLRGEGGAERRVRGRPYSLYGLAFDRNDQLIEELSRAALASIPAGAKFVAHEHRFDTAGENRRHAAAKLASLRTALKARGMDVSRMQFTVAGEGDDPAIGSALQRRLASRVDIIAAP